MDPLTSQPSQEYPIRALVRAGADDIEDLPAGSVIQVRLGAYRRGKNPAGKYGRFDFNDRYYSKTVHTSGADWTWFPDELIINPTPEQIAEERAKAGLPAETAPAVPERSEGSPSLPSPTVPKGGVVGALRKLEAAVQALGDAALPVWDYNPPVYIKAEWEALADALVEANDALSKLEGR